VTGATGLTDRAAITEPREQGYDVAPTDIAAAQVARTVSASSLSRAEVASIKDRSALRWNRP
jgi:hypothetical protein